MASPPFSGNLVGWYNVLPGNFTQSSGNITQLTDLSGTGNTLTNANGSVPYNANSTYNALHKPCMDFGASSNTGQMQTTSFALTDATQIAIFMVAYVNVVASFQQFCVIAINTESNPGGSGDGTVIAPDSTANHLGFFVQNIGFQASFTYPQATHLGLVVVTTNTNESFWYGLPSMSNVVNSNFSNMSLNTAATNRFILGGGWSSGAATNAQQVQILECLVYNGKSFSSSDVASVDTYFTAAWDTASTTTVPLVFSGNTSLVRATRIIGY